MAAWFPLPSRGSGGHAARVLASISPGPPMSTALSPLPDAVRDEPELEALLSRPSAADVEFARTLDGDVVVLGAGGKMGPSLARRVRRSCDAAGVTHRVLAVARFSEPGLRTALERDGIETIACDLLDPGQVGKLPRVPNVLFLAGRKFGSTGRPDLTWAQNVVVPSIVAPHFAASRIVVFSSGNVYPLVPAELHRVDRDGRGRPGGGIRPDLRGPRAGLRARLAGARRALPPLPPLLRGRPPLRHARGRGAPRPLRRAGGPARVPRQRDLAGRRELVCLPWALALREPTSAVGGDGSGERFRPDRRGVLRAALRASCSFHWHPRPRSPGRPGEVRLAPRAARGEPPAPPRLGGRVGASRAGAASASPPTSRPPMDASSELRARLLEGLVIPAHPLALTAERRLDERRQVALTRYYCDAGAGGVAVGVHTTQFAIRSAGLLEPVLRLAAGVVREREAARGRRLVKVAGVVGPTAQAVAEAGLARDLGYDLGLLSLGALREATTDELLAHCRAGGRGPSPLRLLPPARGGRPDSRRGLLAPVPGDRPGRRHQGGALQPLPHPRRRSRPRRERPLRGGRPLHRQRRLDRGGPALPLRARLSPGPLRRGPPRAVGGVDAEGGGASPGDQGVPADRPGGLRPARPRPAAHRRQRRALRRPPRLRRLHRRDPRGAAAAGPPGRALVPGSRARISRRGRRRRSTASSAPTPTSPTTSSWRRTWPDG